MGFSKDFVGFQDSFVSVSFIFSSSSVILMLAAVGEMVCVMVFVTLELFLYLMHFISLGL